MATRTLVVEEEHDNSRVDVYLAKALPDAPSRSFVKKLIEQGCVHVNQLPVKANHKVKIHDEVLVDIPETFVPSRSLEPENIPLDIFYEDEYLAVINKPTGLIVHPAANVHRGTLVNALLHHFDRLSDVNTPRRPGIVHRLDQETSGLIVAAKDNRTHVRLARAFAAHKVNKHYVALVEGEVEFEEGVVEAPLGRHVRHREKRDVRFDEKSKEALTVYRVAVRKNNVTLVNLFPKTGRTHQLRVHMAHIGHPILGDGKYGKASTFSRLALHAKGIGFVHPATKRYVEFVCRSPESFLAKVR